MQAKGIRFTTRWRLNILTWISPAWNRTRFHTTAGYPFWESLHNKPAYWQVQLCNAREYNVNDRIQPNHISNTKRANQWARSHFQIVP